MFCFYHSLVPQMWTKLFAYLHCIIWSEQGHIFYILSLLCSDDAVIRFDFVCKKKHLSIQAWVRVMLVSVCKYHPLVLSLSLFLTCDISLGYMEKQRKEKKSSKEFQQDKRSRYLVPFVKPCWCCDSAERERGCTASRLKGWGNIFVTECKSYSERGKGTSYEGTASFYQNVSKKG